jgi:hypothetical protein
VSELLFPDEALHILRGARYRPDAERSYEVMSDSFWWSDELVREASYVCRRHDSWAFRCLMGYRVSVILGAPDAHLRPVWDQVVRACPEWPGLCRERNSPILARELHRERRKRCVEFLRWERESQGQAAEG